MKGERKKLNVLTQKPRKERPCTTLLLKLNTVRTEDGHEDFHDRRRKHDWVVLRCQ